MYLMFGDEADAEQGRGQKFFVYGAVFIDAANVQKLHDGIQDIRDNFGYGQTDSLKFSGCPRDVSYDDHREVKKAIVKLAHKHDVVFCAYAILHAIARGKALNDMVLFGVNTLLDKFNQFLGERKDVGIAVMDRLLVKGDQFKYLKNKFQLGAEFSDGTKRLENIVGHTITCDGASHLASMADILLGSFRHCVNEPNKDIANAKIFPTLAQVMWHHSIRGEKRYLGYGLTLRPRTIRTEAHAREYTDLRKRLRGYLS
jgi:Protein of unknown function (DUF3800)